MSAVPNRISNKVMMPPNTPPTIPAAGIRSKQLVSLTFWGDCTETVTMVSDGDTVVHDQIIDFQNNLSASFLVAIYRWKNSVVYSRDAAVV